VGLVAIGRIPEMVLKVISGHILGYLNLPTCCLPAQGLPQACLDEKRLQYDAGKIIQHLESCAFADCTKILGLVEADLFVPIFTHVLGEAQQGGDHAVISLSRLQYRNNGTRSSEAEFYERSAKVALHELGHLFNLFHCRDSHCLMHFSGTIETLDAIELNYCPACRNFLDGPRRPALASIGPDG